MNKRSGRSEGVQSERIFEELGRHLFQSSIIPMIMVDTDGIIVKVNSAYEEWCGLSSRELVGRYMPDKVEGSRTHLVARSGVAELHRVQRTFGKTILSSRIPIFDSQNRLIGAWGMVEVNNYDEIGKLMRRIEQQKRRISQYESTLRAYQVGKYVFDDILGQSEGILRAKRDALTAAEAQIDVVIRGETGTGKELFAHAIHNAGPRAGGPFISLNCSALSPSLVEAELFGYEGGSFTDASREGRQGKFELANGGTLFLDEVGDMPVSIQPKLLRAVEAREVTRVGGHRVIPLDLQIIAATNCELEQMVERGVFRRDLYYRLSAYVIRIPPLRARKSDIPGLARFFLEEACRKTGRPVKPIADGCVGDMLRYDWPGNVRELNNYIRNMVIRAEPEERYYTAPGLADAELAGEGQPDGPEPMADCEARALRSALRRSRGNITETARLLQVDRNTVYRKMKKYGIYRGEFQS